MGLGCLPRSTMLKESMNAQAPSETALTLDKLGIHSPFWTFCYATSNSYLTHKHVMEAAHSGCVVFFHVSLFSVSSKQTGALCQIETVCELCLQAQTSLNMRLNSA
ncbi:hypothetical protein GOODEAATRI_007474 [Goodea atripinnis]|uniref:Uncharacterized protein n=1 Tax=Goodea atripinnis TaxID=208336 RepID=A0ABV0PCC8_9TELE